MPKVCTWIPPQRVAREALHHTPPLNEEVIGDRLSPKIWSGLH